MIAKTLNLLTVSVLFVALQAPAARADETADKLAELKKLREKIPTLHTVATMTVRSTTETRESRIELWEKNTDGKHKARRLITAEPGAAKDQTPAPALMVKDGHMGWRELDMGDKKIVFKGKPDARNEYYDIEGLLNKDGVARISSGERLLDQPCVLLEIRQKANPDEVIASYWISEKYGVALKSKVTSVGPTTTETTVTELKLDEELPNSLFIYKPPGDAQVIEGK